MASFVMRLYAAGRAADVTASGAGDDMGFCPLAVLFLLHPTSSTSHPFLQGSLPCIDWFLVRKTDAMAPPAQASITASLASRMIAVDPSNRQRCLSSCLCAESEVRSHIAKPARR